MERLRQSCRNRGAGGAATLFAETSADALTDAADIAAQSLKSLSIVTQRGDKLVVDGRMFTVPWHGSSALALILSNGQASNGYASKDHVEAAARQAGSALGAAETENRELKSILDAATDGVVTLDAEGRIVGANARATALFGTADAGFAGRSFGRSVGARKRARGARLFRAHRARHRHSR